MPIKVLLMENIHDVAAENFKKEGYEVVRHTKLSPEDFEKEIATTNIIGIRSKTLLPKEILEKAPNLLCVGCFCIGTDTTDLPEAARRGIPVFNSPYANTRSVAELVLAEMIMMARQAGDRSMEIHSGTWNKKSKGCHEVRGKQLGIVGYGHVGSQLSVLAESLGMTVVFTDIVNKLALGTAVQVSLDELVATSDFVSLHVPKLKSTENLISAEVIGKMKPGSYLINCARGKVADVDATAEALKSGKLAGAAFDVYPSEPKGYTTEFKSVLQGCPNTILTPHIGGSTEEAQEAIGMEVSDKLIKYVNTGPTIGAVNVPNVDIGGRLQKGYTRIMNYHRDVPGVMRGINEIVSPYNVSYQTLRTGNGIGYVIVDLKADNVEDIRNALDKLDASIRTYILEAGPGYRGEVGSPSPTQSPE
jgi:D-3-phosphoglycerate dehydrogenase